MNEENNHGLIEELNIKQAKQDRRRETSRKNAEKARLTKLAKLKAEKEKEQHIFTLPDVDESSSETDSSSDDEIVIKKKNKNKKREVKQVSKSQYDDNQTIKQQLSELTSMMADLKRKQKKSKAKRKYDGKGRQIINIVPPTQSIPVATTDNDVMDIFKKQILMKF